MGIASEADLATALLRLDELEQADPESPQWLERIDLLEQVKAYLALPVRVTGKGPGGTRSQD